VRQRLRAQDADLQIRDLHLWRLGPGHYGLTLSLQAARPLTPAQYKAQLAGLDALSHVTIEVNQA
jgi:Co/Zn/Cd efflux system component